MNLSPVTSAPATFPPIGYTAGARVAKRHERSGAEAMARGASAEELSPPISEGANQRPRLYYGGRNSGGEGGAKPRRRRETRGRRRGRRAAATI